MGVGVKSVLRIWICRVVVCMSATCCSLPAQESTLRSLEIQLEPLHVSKSSPVVSAIAVTEWDDLEGVGSANGRSRMLIAAAGDDHAIRLIDAGQNKVLRTLAAHTDWIQTLAFSRDKRELYSGGDDGRVIRWSYVEQQTGREIVRLDFAVRSISVSTKQRLLAVAGFGEIVGVWDLAANHWKYQFTCPGGDQRCVIFSPSGTKLFSGGRNGEIRVWDLAAGELICKYPGHSGRIHTAAFSTDERTVTSVGEDRKLLKFDIYESRQVIAREFHGVKLLSMCLINDHLVAAAGSDNLIRVYDLLADAEIGKLKGHSGSVTVMTTCGDQLVSGAFDTTLRIWDLPTLLGAPSGAIRPVGLAPLKKDKDLDIQ